MEPVYKNISNYMQDLYNTVKQLDIITIYRTLYLIKEQKTYSFQSAHRTLTNIDHILSIKQVSINLKMIQSYKLCSLTIVELS